MRLTSSPSPEQRDEGVGFPDGNAHSANDCRKVLSGRAFVSCSIVGPRPGIVTIADGVVGSRREIATIADGDVGSRRVIPTIADGDLTISDHDLAIARRDLAIACATPTSRP